MDLELTDGGRYSETHYAWYNPETDSYLYHTEVNGEYANPFFDDEDEARAFLELQAEAGTKEAYMNLSPHQLLPNKVGKVVEVLRDPACHDGIIQALKFSSPHSRSTDFIRKCHSGSVQRGS